MSAHTHPESRHASPAEPTVEHDADSTSDEDSPDASSDTHDSPATFDTGSTTRLPNTVDGENKRVV